MVFKKCLMRIPPQILIKVLYRHLLGRIIVKTLVGVKQVLSSFREDFFFNLRKVHITIDVFNPQMGVKWNL